MTRAKCGVLPVVVFGAPTKAPRHAKTPLENSSLSEYPPHELFSCNWVHSKNNALPGVVIKEFLIPPSRFLRSRHFFSELKFEGLL